MRGKRIKAVVFDMDGLMFNTEDLYDQVGQELLGRRKRVFSNELKMKLMGLPGPVAYQLIIDEFHLEDSVETLQAESDEIFSELLPREIKNVAFPRHHTVALVTSEDQEDLPRLMIV